MGWVAGWRETRGGVVKLWIGLAMLIVGVIAAAVVFICNGSTPIQLGPITFFGSIAVAFVGAVVFISGL